MTDDAVVRETPPPAFAETAAPDAGALLAAPWRGPQAAALSAPLRIPNAGEKQREAAVALGLATVGDLLAHLPRDTRESRTVAELGKGEQATVTVEVRSITSRPVRRRGMRPIVEAVVADESGAMKAAFFNQPWLVSKYPAGTRLVLHGHVRRAQPLPRHLARADDARGWAARATWRTTRRRTGSPRPRSSRWCRSTCRSPARRPSRSRAACARGTGCRTARPPCSRRTAETTRAAAAGSPSTSCCCPARLLRRRAHRREGRAGARPAVRGGRPGRRARPQRALARALCCRSRSTGDQRRAIDADRRRPAARACRCSGCCWARSAPARRSSRSRAMLRAVEHGRQAALMAPTEMLAEQHFATLQRAAARRGACRAALLTGLHAGRAPHATSSASSRSGELELVVGTHALIEDDVRVRRARPRRWSTSSTASACSSARRWTRKAPAGSRRTCCS